MKRIYFSISVIFLAITFLKSQHQPEYSGFETVENKDMVNLSTGDFVYNIPLVNVPGPEGGFSLPISYYGGIKLEQEASWVGLGWNMNVGAINRSISGYPDDFKGEAQVQHSEATGAHGWVKNRVLWSTSWDSERGSGGSVSLLGYVGYGWGTQSQLTILGIGISDGEFTADPVSIISSALSIVTSGISETATGVAKTVRQIASSLKQAVGVASSAVSYSKMAMGMLTANNVTNIGYWQVHKKGFFNMEYKSYLNIDKEIYQYGTLYLQDVPEQKNNSNTTSYSTIVGLYEDQEPHGDAVSYNRGLRRYKHSLKLEENPAGSQSVTGIETHVHDMHMPVNGTNYEYSIEPVSLAPDKYTVMGDGVSGSIQPYRLEAASLAFPNVDPSYHSRFILGEWQSALNKEELPQFKYVGQIENSYTYHDLENNDFEIDFSTATNGEAYLLLRDSKLKTRGTDAQPFENRTENQGLKKTRLQSGKHIVWLRNQDFTSQTFASSNLMDYLAESERTSFRASVPAHGIGGFSITNEVGVTYHYALPVYNNYSYSEFRNTKKDNSLSTHTESNKYAISWLLTGITGPDFIDNGSGHIDEADLGYWVKFEYGKFSEDYESRIPFTAGTYSHSPADVDEEYYSKNRKQLYYLDEIKTRSHTAIFVKSSRKDGRSASSTPTHSLRLDEIIILRNTDYQTLINSKGMTKSSSGGGSPANDNYNNIWNGSDISSNQIIDYIIEEQEKRVVFNYNYDLCKGTPNSFINLGSGVKFGKLALKSIKVLGQQNSYLVPSYSFNYFEDDEAHNPNYLPEAFDGWGYYNGNKAKGLDNHLPLLDGAQWSLKEINLPVGGTIKINYERDFYTNVSGHSVTDMEPTGISGNRIYFKTGINLNNFCKVGDDINARITAEQDCQKFDRIDPANYIIITRDLDYPSAQTVTGIASNYITINNPPTLLDEVDPQQYDNCNDILLSGYIETDNSGKYGGDVRVESVELSDGDKNYKTKYLYDGGTCSVEPEYCRARSISSFYEGKKLQLVDYPFTPVIYNNVTMLTNYSSGNYSQKSSYYFTTPSDNMIDINYTQRLDEDRFGNYQLHPKIYNVDIDISTTQIGNLTKIVHENEFKDMLQTEYFNYVSEDSYYNGMGHYTEGTLLCENLYKSEIHWFKLLRTVKKHRPNILRSVRTITNKSDITKTNIKYDRYTGILLEESSTDGINTVTTSVIPAHQKYAGMGSRFFDGSNKNMLTQSAGSINKKNGKVINASIQTWNDSWGNYFTWDNTAGEYNYDGQDPAPVWRKHQTYIWRGGLDEEGAYSNSFDTYNNVADVIQNWNNITNELHDWKKTGEVIRYDFSSTPIEVEDINSDIASVKKDPNDIFTIATAFNSSHSCFAATSFEFQEQRNASGISYYDYGCQIMGLVSVDQRISSLTENNVEAHTGSYLIKVNNGVGPFYDIKKGNGIFTKNCYYQASVWIHNTSDESGIKVIIGKETGPSEFILVNDADMVGTFGDWKLLNANFHVSDDAKSIKVQLYTFNGVGYFDDFRIAPFESAVTAYCYDKVGQVTAILNNDNFATKYEYDKVGRLTETHVEKPTGFEKVSSSNYNYENSAPISNAVLTGPTSFTRGDDVAYQVGVTGGSGQYSYEWTITHNASPQLVLENLITYNSEYKPKPGPLNSQKIKCLIRDLANGSEFTTNELYFYVAPSSTAPSCQFKITSSQTGPGSNLVYQEGYIYFPYDEEVELEFEAKNIDMHTSTFTVGGATRYVPNGAAPITHSYSAKAGDKLTCRVEITKSSATNFSNPFGRISIKSLKRHTASIAYPNTISAHTYSNMNYPIISGRDLCIAGKSILYSIPAPTGGSGIVTYRWEIWKDGNWVQTVSGSTGNANVVFPNDGNYELVCHITDNESYQYRKLSKAVVVYPDIEYTISTNVSSHTFGYTNPVGRRITVTTNGPGWNTTIIPTWITIMNQGASGFTIYTGSNGSFENKTGTIKLVSTLSDDIFCNLSVYQNYPHIVIDPTSLQFNYTGLPSRSVDITCDNCTSGWTAEVLHNNTWVGLSNTQGTGFPGAVTVSCTRLSDSHHSDRNAYIRIKPSDSNLYLTLPVLQTGAPELCPPGCEWHKDLGCVKIGRTTPCRDGDPPPE